MNTSLNSVVNSTNSISAENNFGHTPIHLNNEIPNVVSIDTQTQELSPEKTIIALTQSEIVLISQHFIKTLPSLYNVYYIIDYNGLTINLKRIKPAHCPSCNREHEHEDAYIVYDNILKKVYFYCRYQGSNPIIIADYDQQPKEYELMEGNLLSNLFLGQKGPAEIIIERYKNNFRVISPKGPIYIYKDENKLWYESVLTQFGVHLSYLLEFVIVEEESRINKASTDLKGKGVGPKDSQIVKLDCQLDLIRELRKRFSRICFLKLVAEWICCATCDTEYNKLFDMSRGFLPIINGQVIDMRTGQVKAREKEHYFTYEIQINYVPGKRHELLDKFISEIMLEHNKQAEERTKVKFLKRLVGYSLTGECREQVMVVLTGEDGSNGKSTLCNFIKTCMPFIVKSADKSIVMKRNNTSAANPELHMLRNCRIALVSETAENEYINEDVFKRMTGGDEVQSRNLYTNTVSWTPKFVPWMITNNVPKCTGDKATLRRILIFNFYAKFMKQPGSADHELPADKTLDLKLSEKDVQEAFLNWVIEGSIDYYNQGELNPPEEVLEATDQYRKMMDTFLLFVEDEVDSNKTSDDEELFGNLFARYKEVCQRDDRRPKSSKAFAKDLVRYGAEYHKSGSVYYRNIKLITNNPPGLLLTTAQIVQNYLDPNGTNLF